MSKKKKNRKTIDQRRLKANQRKNERRKQAKKREQSSSSYGVDRMLSRPPMAEMEAPEGFRTIGMAQAMMTFANPLIELTKEDEGVDINEALQLGMTIWNYEIAMEKGIDSEGMKREIIRQIQRVLRLDLPGAINQLEQMVARKRFLFPSDVESGNPMVMFMRKEMSHQISEFDYEGLTIQDEVVPIDEADAALAVALQGLEQKIKAGEDYSDWEDEFFDVKDHCCKRFSAWLHRKGASEEYCQKFPSCVETYLNFVYGYMHSGIVTLQQIPADEMEEFFSDYLLRKVMVAPQEYTHWIPALKLFYRFLAEKEYLTDARPVIELLDQLEPGFLDILRKQFE